MTLDELKKRAEGAIARRAEGYLEAQCSYAVVLKLLQMIAVLETGIKEEHAHWEDDNTPDTCYSTACQALVRANEIERSLRE